MNTKGYLRYDHEKEKYYIADEHYNRVENYQDYTFEGYSDWCSFSIEWHFIDDKWGFGGNLLFEILDKKHLDDEENYKYICRALLL